ncbi:MAG: helix-turn-helix domain-containing protein [Chloroflexi bacterium]|nr:helix-turn-helix domain-containing protein [Chloroflexota bacterium]
MAMIATRAEDILRLALPPGTEVIGGRDGLSKEVTWASTMRSVAPAFPSFREGEMALLSVSSLQLQDPPMTLSRMIHGLAQRGASAFAVLGAFPAGAAETANALHIALFSLPPTTKLHELERVIVSLITERRTELYKRSMDIHRRLTNLSIEGRGLIAILKETARFVDKTVIFADEDLNPRSWSGAGGRFISREDVQNIMVGRETIPKLAGDIVDCAEPPCWQVVTSLGKHLMVLPVVVKNVGKGYLLIVGDGAGWQGVDEAAAAQSAAVCALEMAKEQAVQEAESRWRGDVLDALLDGDMVSEEAVSSQARYLNDYVSRPYTVIIFKPEAHAEMMEEMGEGLVSVIREELGRWGKASLYRRRGGAINVLYPLGNAEDPVSLKKIVEEVCHRAAERTALSFAAGLGGPHRGVRELADAHKEADQALAVATDFFGGNRVVCFGELGVYRLFLPLRDSRELGAYCEETLGKLAAYDQRNKRELIKTLDTFFSCQGNLQRTAVALFLHRNSLAYRLRRVEEIAGLSLDDGEDRFRLQLALKLRRLCHP